MVDQSSARTVRFIEPCRGRVDYGGIVPARELAEFATCTTTRSGHPSGEAGVDYGGDRACSRTRRVRDMHYYAVRFIRLAKREWTTAGIAPARELAGFATCTT